MKKATVMRTTATALLIAGVAGCASAPRPLVAANDNVPSPPPMAPAPVAANDNVTPSARISVTAVGRQDSIPVVRYKAAKDAKPAGESLIQHLVPGKDRSHVDALEPAFAEKLAELFAAMPTDLAAKTKILSGYRSIERQRVLFDQAVKKYGSVERARKFVAPPGKSKHQHGLAVDLNYGGSADARAWVHKNAGKFGLYFPMSWEPWHIEPVGSRSTA